MYWNYRVAKNKEGFYGIIEVYYDKKGSASGWTDFCNPGCWDNPEDLKGTLELMLKAFDKPLFEAEIE